MPKLTFKCPLCNKDLVLVKEIQLGQCKLNAYKCGHVFAKTLHKLSKENLDFASVDGSGKRARPYQEDGIEFIINSDFNCIIGDQMRLGKAGPISEKVLTSKGWSTYGQLTLDDKIANPDGSFSNLTGIYPQGVRKIAKVTFTDGTFCYVDFDHLWIVKQVRSHGEYLYSTREILHKGVKDLAGNNNWRIQVTEPVKFSEKVLPIEPYLLGVILGDGSIGDTYTCIDTDKEILDSLGLTSVKKEGCYRANLSSSLAFTLSNLQLDGCTSDTKFIPAKYLLGSIEQRLAILQGLLDTDGSPIEGGGIEFCSTSEQLVDGVIELVQSLGGIARNKKSRVTNYTYKEEVKQGKQSWRVNVRIPENFRPFRLRRKFMKYVEPTKFKITKIIDSIKYDREEEALCIRVDNPNHLYLTRSYIVTHNTPQALLALKNAYKDRTPCLIIVRGANLWQWTREYKTWCDILPNGIYPIIGGNAWIPQGFSAYVIGMDTFSRPKMLEALKKIPFKLVIADEAHSFKNTDSNRSQALVDFIAFLNTGEEPTALDFTCARCGNTWTETGKQKFDKRIGHTVLSKSSKCSQCGNYCYQQQQHTEKDKYCACEHTILHHTPANITEQNKEVAKDYEAWFSGQGHMQADSEVKLDTHCKHCTCKEFVEQAPAKPCGLILLSGTVIKNRAEETFVPLNLVAPDKVTSLEGYRRTWLDQDEKGKWNRIKSYRLNSWKEFVKPYMLRREWADVYTELPELNRTFTVIDPGKDKLTEAYNTILDQLETKLADKVNPTYWDMADELMELRRICGLMKVPYTSDYVESLLGENGGQRYAIGLHHEAVRDVLYAKLGGNENCLKLDGSSTPSSESKDRVMREFEASKQHILLIGMLAGGVGMDFRYCDNVIILERAWSAADEVQFEARFYNPDLSLKNRPTNVEYILIRNSIESFFYELVETKRKIFGETLGTNWSVQSDTRSFKDLVDQTLGSRL